MLLPFLVDAAEEAPMFAAHDPIDLLTKGWLSQFNIWTIIIRIRFSSHHPCTAPADFFSPASPLQSPLSGL